MLGCLQLIEATETVLSMFDKKISEATAENFKRENIDVHANTFVKEVHPALSLALSVALALVIAASVAISLTHSLPRRFRLRSSIPTACFRESVESSPSSRFYPRRIP